MTWFLFRFRGELLAAWGLAAVYLSWPAQGCLASLTILVAGICLRLWARRHIGPHSRGRELACPEKSTRGPYRHMRHPLYVANLLVVASLALSLAGPGWMAMAFLIGPSLLYGWLARAENRFVALASAPERVAAHDRISGGWRSEWASTLPQIGLWIVLQIPSIP